MRQSIWKLTALVGISGFGFLVLLQVQKSLHDAGVAQAAEMAPETAPASKPIAARQNTPKKAPPGRVRLDALPAEPSDPAPVGLDFRRDVPTAAKSAAAGSGLTRTAEAELKPIPQRDPHQAIAADNPFAELNEPLRPEPEPKPIITPAGFESPAATNDPPTGETTPAEESTLEPADEPAFASQMAAESDPFGGAADFGPDPFAELGPLTPDADAAGLEEPPGSLPESPSRLLEANDPFGELSPAEPMEASEPTSEAAPAAEDEPFVPAMADDPFATESDLKPANSDEPAPIEEGATVPIEEGATVPIDGPASSEPNPFEFGDDPFADMPAPASEPEQTPSEPASPMPEPALEPMPETAPADEDPTPFPLEPTFDPAFDTPGPSTEPAVEPTPSEPLPDTNEPGFEEEPAAPPSSDERAPVEPRGVGTVSPDDPRGPQHAQITVEKKAPERAVLGQPLVYEIIVKNVGESAAHDVVVSDVVPKGTSLGGTIPRAEMAGAMLVWKLGTLEPGKSAKIKVKVTPIEPGVIGSVAIVNFVSEVAAQTEIIAPSLALKISAPSQVMLGQPVDFRFDIANEGNAPAENVLLRDLLPEGFSHADGNDLEYEVGTLPPGKVETVTLRVATVKPGSYTNNATLTAAGGLKAESSAAVEIADSKVIVTRQGPKRRYVGRPAMYANIVKNRSNEVVPGVRIIETVPAGMEFVQASHGGQFDAATRTVTWQTGPLRPGQEHTVQVVLTAVEEGVQDSTLRVEEHEGSAIELASSTSVSRMPSLAPTMQGPDKPIIVGERTAFRIRVKNRGNADATEVVVSLALPEQLRFVEARGGEVNSTPDGVASVRLNPSVRPGAEQLVEFIIEGAAPGTARIRAQVKASHMSKSLVRDEELIVLAPKS